MACQQLPHPNDDGYDGDGGERGREGGEWENARSVARSPIAVYGLRQIVVAFLGIASAAAPAALLSEIRRVIARLRLHLPAHAPSPGAWRRICYSLFHSYACVRAFLCLPLMFQNTTLPFMRCNLAFEVDVEWRARERETASLPLSCLLHACSLPRSLARCLARSHACNTYIYSCPSPSVSLHPSFLPCPFGPFRTIANDFAPSSVGLRPLNGPQFKTTTAAAEEATERPPLALSPCHELPPRLVPLRCCCSVAAPPPPPPSAVTLLIMPNLPPLHSLPVCQSSSRFASVL